MLVLSVLISSLLAPLIRRLRRHLPPNSTFLLMNFSAEWEGFLLLGFIQLRRAGRLAAISF